MDGIELFLQSVTSFPHHHPRLAGCIAAAIVGVICFLALGLGAMNDLHSANRDSHSRD